MHKFYKHKLYRKYHDEIWGQIASSKKFTYNKKSVLIKFRDVIIKKRLRVKTKFKYFRRGFLKHLKNTAFIFRRSRKTLRTSLFVQKKKFSISYTNLKPKFFKASKTSVFLKLGLLLISQNILNKVCTYPRSTCQFGLIRKNYPFSLSLGLKRQIFYKMR
jgi:hypothetical protein